MQQQRFLTDTIPLEYEKAQRHGLTLSLVLLDIDDFKKIKDRLGHATGDKVLAEVEKIIKTSVRDVDITGRYNGERLCILLPGTPLKRALGVAERLRSAIVEHTFNDGKTSFNITVSLGVSCISDEGTDSADDLLERADKNLSADRQIGRNRAPRKKDTSLVQYGEKTLTALYIQSIRALVNALELKDGYTATHSYMVSHYATSLASKLGLGKDMIEVIRTAGLLHDVGKVGVPDDVLKKNGPLSQDEYTVVKTHPVLSIKVLNDMVFLRRELEIVRYHQEKYDGTGYPYGLRGENIPLGARILAICDTFEAMTANRPYRKALPVETAVEEIKNHADTQFDPRLVDLFIDSLPDILSTRQIYLEGLNKTVELPQFSSKPHSALKVVRDNPKKV
ncbi:MAG: HD-GYP domain-containing protein [Candidatus Brocadiales bacterium]